MVAAGYLTEMDFITSKKTNIDELNDMQIAFSGNSNKKTNRQRNRANY